MKKIRFDKTKINNKTIIVVSFLLIIIIVLISWTSISVAWNSKYDKNSFNCVDMSYAVGCFLKSIGIPTQMVYGYNPVTNTGHCWLLCFGCIEFESTTLYPKFFNKNSDKYIVDVVEEIK